jgi:hypothetical protein
MPNFLTRVELHGATDADYNTLHEDMTKRGFARTIRSGDMQYKLPTAEYECSTNLTCSQVRDVAIEAAKITGRNHWVLTVEYVNSAWVLVPTT